MGDDIYDKQKQLWAKKNRVDNRLKWLPLMVHLNDTGKVCGLLFEHWLSNGVKEFLKKSIKMETNCDAEILKNICMFIGLTHDIGKATPIFQVKKSFINDTELDDCITNKLKNAGFIDIDKYQANAPTNIPHNECGQYILTKYNVNLCIANIIGSHHGRPIDKDTVERNEKAYPSSYYQEENEDHPIHKEWEKIHKNILDWAAKKSNLNIDNLPLISQPGQVILSGLLIMADWITSNEIYFPLLDIDIDIDLDSNNILNDRVKEGYTKWQNSKTASWTPKTYYSNMYKDRFGFINGPKPAQEKIARVVQNIDEPGIIILEAPMGMGKTEAALTMVEELSYKTERTGMFFGLPTQATSNGIFSRVKNWISTMDDEKSIRLIHGKAALNEEFSNLPKSKNIHGEDGISVNEWFAGRKVSILDDFIVGTVDQILLSALKQKHLMLRHLGLSNKVIVLDEVHAYDTYMSTYLYQALRWLGAYHVPVIVLSATLPIEKRNDLLKSYMVGVGYNFKKIEKPNGFLEKESYPLLTYNDGDKIIQYDDFIEDKGRDFSIIKKSEDDSNDIINTIKDLTYEGGIVGVILNTIRKSQEFFQKCVKEFGSENVLLLHSSFIATDRYKKEQELLDTIGKNGKRPRFKVVIGTQVIEQSLDIDFDVLITDLAPMDLLLQRMGRLHRHNRNDRPSKLKDPKVYILNCKGYDFDEGSTYVYDKYMLFKTEYFLPENINLPKDISHLVQQVYGEDNLKLNDEKCKIYKDYQEKFKIKIEKSEQKAKTYRIDKPLISKITEEKNLSNWIKDSNKKAEASDIKASAEVRDGMDTIEVIALKKCDGGYEFFDKKGVLNPGDNRTAIEMLKRTIKLPNSVYYGCGIDKIIEILENYYLDNFSDWNNQSWLKGSLGIIFDYNNEFKINDKILRYDTKCGLKVEKEFSSE